MTSAADIQQHLVAGDKAAVTELVNYIKSKGAPALKADGLIAKAQEAAANTTSPAVREVGLDAIAALAKEVGVAVEPYLVPVLPTILDKYADKAAPVREAAAKAGKAIVAIASPHSVKVILPYLFDAMEVKKVWQTKIGALQLLEAWTKSAPKELARSLPQIVPVATGCLADPKPQVKTTAIKALTSACAALGNKDVDPFVPRLINALANPDKVPDTIHGLGATTFVQAVEAPTLSILVPLLVRGLRDRATPIKRKSALIIDNMSKLVDDPSDAAVFLPRLLPGLDHVRNEVANPECREVANRAHATLLRVGAQGKISVPTEEEVAAEAKAVRKALDDVITANSSKKVDEVIVEYVTELALQLIRAKNFKLEEWDAKAVTPYLAAVLPKAEAEAVCKAFLDRVVKEEEAKAALVDQDEEDGDDLCNAEFSLAYGGKILLNNARLWLKRGKRYGLCGPNGCGKSTLMRAIANGQLEGFPSKDELRTVYVEHDIDAAVSDMAVVDFIVADPNLQETTRPDKAHVEEVLESVGFTDVMRASPITSLSGGWKMKLALARAMLMKADIMLLDEPTNHLDVKNVAWLENYLTHLPDVTSMIVSHDSGFLDNVCTGIIHYEDLKLRRYKGNLAEFVKQKPEARAYYELASENIKFVLPEPGFLEGIKSKDRAVLKMAKCGIRYPGMTKNVISNVTIQCSLNSRVAVLGANGAGKSTMIKALTGELEPQEGTVWKHPNLRVAYVAQHAFHHIENHLDKTPNQYIQWRYASGEDREGVESAFRKISDEEAAKMAQVIKAPDGTKKVVDKLLGRRKLKRSYEYEVAYVGLHPDYNEWLTRDKLEEMGFVKLVNEIDMKEAARLGLVTRPLTEAVVQKHLQDLGIEPEFGTHSQIRGLSGGQKVKVVIAAAMWNNPHILILDEPTNYLDRDSLGALATAIKEYGGGVIMISHSSEFTSALCPETWLVENGELTIKGQTEAQQQAAKLEWKRQEEMTDAFGNVIKIKAPKKKLSNKEKKARAKVRAARRDRGEEVSDSEEDE
jgi:elongation factor 3